MKKRSLTIFLLVFVMTACNAVPSNIASFEDAREECPAILPTPEPKPEFLEWVYPDGNISNSDYETSIQLPEPGVVETGGIQAVISADRLDQSILTSVQRDRGDLLSKRIVLIVDNAIVSGEPEFIIDGFEPHGPFVFNWTMDLGVGIHNSSLVFTLHTGETIEYSWSFCITP